MTLNSVLIEDPTAPQLAAGNGLAVGVQFGNHMIEHENIA